MKVFVLGGRGFIGSNIVKALIFSGHDVFIGGRSNINLSPEMKTVRMERMLDADTWLDWIRDNELEEVDVIVNCVGILRQRWVPFVSEESYRNVHTVAPEALAKACKIKGIRFVHISALGLSQNAKSQFIRSKFNGEKAVLNTGYGAVVIRAPLLDGTLESLGFGAKWFRRVAKWPVHFVMCSPGGAVSPIKVDEFGEVVGVVCALPANKLSSVYEVGAKQELTIAQYLDNLRSEYSDSRALVVEVPRLLVRLISHIFDAIYFSPLSFGHVELMSGKNVPSVNSFHKLMGREPVSIGRTRQIRDECEVIAGTD